MRVRWLPSLATTREDGAVYRSRLGMDYPLYCIGNRHHDTTAYLRWLFLDHIHRGEGGTYIDFSGNIDGLLHHLPDDRSAVLFLPMDTEYPLGLNLLHQPLDRRATLEAIVNAFRSVWPSDIATTRIDLYLKAAILSLFDVPDATLLGLSELFTNDDYRKRVLSHLRDPVLTPFWARFEQLPQKDRITVTESTVTRAFTFAIDPIVRNIIGQKKTTFTVSPTTVLVASFPPDLGLEMGNFLATLLLSQLPDGMLTVLDDGHRIGTAAVRQALTRLNLAFSHQYAAQLRDGLRETLIGTAQTIVAFAVGPTDSKRLSPEFGIVQEADCLHHFASGEYRIRGEGEDARHTRTFDVPPFPPYDAPFIKANSRHYYARPRAHVEAQLMTAVTDKPQKRRAPSRSRGRSQGRSQGRR